MRALQFYTIFCFVCCATYGQTKEFKLTYQFAGLGSNFGEVFYPIVKINGTTLTYTIEQNISVKKIKKYKTIIDTIWNSKIIDYSINLSQETIDTLFNLVKDSKDTLIFKSNSCYMSGGIYFISITDRSFKVKYELMNTFDSTALLICNIINSYLPKKNKVWTEPNFAKEKKDCEVYLDKLYKEDEKKDLKKVKS